MTKVRIAGRDLTVSKLDKPMFPEEGISKGDLIEHYEGWIPVAHAPRRGRPGTVDHAVCDDAATVVYLANQATVEFHVWTSTVDKLEGPDRLTTAQRKLRRGDRAFLDVNRNSYGQTFVAPYSLRARPGAPSATPLDWSELGRSTPNAYHPRKLRQRLARKADPWADLDDAAAQPDTVRTRFDAIMRP